MSTPEFTSTDKLSIVLLFATAIAFGAWQQNVFAGLWMFCGLSFCSIMWEAR